MTKRNEQAATRTTKPVMVWSITDEVIEDRELLNRQFHEMVGAGFGGVAAYVRCSRYSWSDPLAMQAWRAISELCRKNRLECWLGPDPRFVSHKVVSDGTGLELLLFGDAARANVAPHTARVEHGRFSIRCSLAPRHVHTMTDVAVEYSPVALEKVYAFRGDASGVRTRDIFDITPHAQMFYNARDRYVEAFGKAPSGIGEGASLLAFFRVRTNHFDFSSPKHLDRYDRMLSDLKKNGCLLDGVMWDEPGYTCLYGSIPVSPAIEKGYRARRSRSLGADLWKIALCAENQSEIPVRQAYYDSVQDSITQAELRLKSVVKRLWGPSVWLGVHDTWHFESADMCDMNHGSMNLWATAKAKSAGFVDLGAVGGLADPNAAWYSNLAAMSVIAASLGKQTGPRGAYNNLWTTGDDEGDGSQRRAMEHCVQVMGLFGTRWMAHAYGPVGTVGQERTFLGSPPLPGYPDHSTWQEFPRWNRLLSDALKASNCALPTANLLVLYPIETLYSYADPRADHASAEIFSLLLALLDNHYHVDVLATSIARNGHCDRGRFLAGGGTYDAVIFPHPRVVEKRLRQVVKKAKVPIIYAFGRPEYGEDGRNIAGKSDLLETGIHDVIDQLKQYKLLRPVAAPDGSWVTLTPAPEGMLVSIAPSRCGFQYAGELRYHGESMVLQESETLQRILFPRNGGPRIA